MDLRDPAHTVTTFYYGNSVKYPRKKRSTMFQRFKKSDCLIRTSFAVGAGKKVDELEPNYL